MQVFSVCEQNNPGPQARQLVPPRPQAFTEKPVWQTSFVSQQPMQLSGVHLGAGDVPHDASTTNAPHHKSTRTRNPVQTTAPAPEWRPAQSS